MADQRVKLVFADELGRFLLRKRGFSSCWFLVPTSAKIVGDLAHEIRHEFGLSVARCPSGVDLVLEKLHLLPSHDIRVVRDNDEICVQCSSSIDSASSRSGAVGALRRPSQQLALLEASDNDDVEVQSLQEKRVKRRGEKKEKKKREAVDVSEKTEKRTTKKEAKKVKRVEKTRKPVVKEPDSSDDSSSSSSDSDETEAKQQIAVASKLKKRKAIVASPVESSDSSSSSSSSSSDSSDNSSSGSEDEKKQSSMIALQPERKRQRVETSKTGTATRPTSKSAVPAKKTAAVTGKANAEGEPRQRRRRRPRNRKPREERARRPSEKGAAAPSVAIRSAALPSVPGDRPAHPLALLPPPVAQPQQRFEAPPSTESTSAAIVKGHVRFGGAGETQVVQRTNAEPDGNSPGGDALNIRKPRAYASPELQKYGPQHSASNGRGPHQPPLRGASVRSSNGNHNQQTNGQRTNDSSSSQTLQNDAADPLANGTSNNKTKKKAKWDTLWKRPYEIVSTIHDQSPQDQSDDANPITVRSPITLVFFHHAFCASKTN